MRNFSLHKHLLCYRTHFNTLSYFIFIKILEHYNSPWRDDKTEAQFVPQFAQDHRRRNWQSQDSNGLWFRTPKTLDLCFFLLDLLTILNVIKLFVWVVLLHTETFFFFFWGMRSTSDFTNFLLDLQVHDINSIPPFFLHLLNTYYVIHTKCKNIKRQCTHLGILCNILFQSYDCLRHLSMHPFIH